jgi:hypothetical protein
MSTNTLPALCNDAIANTRSYEYLSIREVATLLEKSLSRTYAMAQEGLLTEVGFLVLRVKNGRTWVGIPTCGLSQLNSTEKKGDP